MKMKRVFAFVLLALLLFSGCIGSTEKENQDETQNESIQKNTEVKPQGIFGRQLIYADFLGKSVNEMAEIFGDDFIYDDSLFAGGSQPVYYNDFNKPVFFFTVANSTHDVTKYTGDEIINMLTLTLSGDSEYALTEKLSTNSTYEQLCGYAPESVLYESEDSGLWTFGFRTGSTSIIFEWITSPEKLPDSSADYVWLIDNESAGEVENSDGSYWFKTYIGSEFVVPSDFVQNFTGNAAVGRTYTFFNQTLEMRIRIHEATFAALSLCTPDEFMDLNYDIYMNSIYDVTYNVKSDSFSVVSGYRSDGRTVFYTKSINDGDCFFIEIEFTYPKEQKGICDYILSDFLDSFHAPSEPKAEAQNNELLQLMKLTYGEIKTQYSIISESEEMYGLAIKTAEFYDTWLYFYDSEPANGKFVDMICAPVGAVFGELTDKTVFDLFDYFGDSYSVSTVVEGYGFVSQGLYLPQEYPDYGFGFLYSNTSEPDIFNEVAIIHKYPSLYQQYSILIGEYQNVKSAVEKYQEVASKIDYNGTNPPLGYSVMLSQKNGTYSVTCGSFEYSYAEKLLRLMMSQGYSEAKIVAD